MAAEQLIQMLRSQINEIRSFSNQEKSHGSSEDQEIKTLALENAQLKQKIIEQKALLVAAETKAGVKHVTSDIRGNTESKPPGEVPEKVKDTQEDAQPDTSVDKKTEKKKKEKSRKETAACN